MAILIHSDGSQTTVRPEQGNLFHLEQMQELVGGYIQMLYLPSGRVLVIDEEGKMKAKPPNERATLLGQSAGIAPDDIVVGDVLLCERSEFE